MLSGKPLGVFNGEEFMDGRDIMDLLDGVGGCIRLLTQLGFLFGQHAMRQE